MFKFYNSNPLNNDVSDCTTRAISLAEGTSWDYCYNKLSNLARKKGVMMDNVDFIEDYLDDRYPRQCHYSKTIREFIKEHPYGVYLCTMTGHITCVIDGCIYDTYNCSNRTMRCAWKIE